MVKTINVSFEDKEFTKIRKAKELSNSSSWREWILLLIKRSEEENDN
jgi:hypothetical protein